MNRENTIKNMSYYLKVVDFYKEEKQTLNEQESGQITDLFLDKVFPEALSHAEAMLVLDASLDNAVFPTQTLSCTHHHVAFHQSGLYICDKNTHQLSHIPYPWLIDDTHTVVVYNKMLAFCPTQTVQLPKVYRPSNADDDRALLQGMSSLLKQHHGEMKQSLHHQANTGASMVKYSNRDLTIYHYLNLHLPFVLEKEHSWYSFYDNLTDKTVKRHPELGQVANDIMYNHLLYDYPMSISDNGDELYPWLAYLQPFVNLSQVLPHPNKQTPLDIFSTLYGFFAVTEHRER